MRQCCHDNNLGADFDTSVFSIDQYRCGHLQCASRILNMNRSIVSKEQENLVFHVSSDVWWTFKKHDFFPWISWLPPLHSQHVLGAQKQRFCIFLKSKTMPHLDTTPLSVALEKLHYLHFISFNLWIMKNIQISTFLRIYQPIFGATSATGLR